VHATGEGQPPSDGIILMADPAVAGVRVDEVGEPLVDARACAHPCVRVGAPRDATGAFAHVRAGVLDRLARAAEALPGGLELLLVEGFRPPALQRRHFDAYREELAGANPGWSPQQLRTAASRYVSPPEVAPHTAGAAVDVTLCDTSG
jgi:D-alanyl-D-alanine dipeptidase